jgi:hypothetical protein
VQNKTEEEGEERGRALARKVTANFERAMHERMTNTMTSVRIPRYLLLYARLAHINMSAILSDALRRRWLKKHERCSSKASLK